MSDVGILLWPGFARKSAYASTFQFAEVQVESTPGVKVRQNGGLTKAKTILSIPKSYQICMPLDKLLLIVFSWS